MNSKKMSFWLEQLVVEVRKLDGTEYSSIISYYVAFIDIQERTESMTRTFQMRKNVYFARFSRVLNARMRTLNEKGFGFAVKRADPILPEQLDKLLGKGVFRQGSGGQLQLIIFLYACKLFGLRTREDYHLQTLDQFFLERTEMEDLSCLLDGLPRLIIKESQASLLFRARVSNTIQNLRSAYPIIFLSSKESLIS